MGRKKRRQQAAVNRTKDRIKAIMGNVMEVSDKIKKDTDGIIQLQRSIRENYPLVQKPEAKRPVLTLVK